MGTNSGAWKSKFMEKEKDCSGGGDGIEDVGIVGGFEGSIEGGGWDREANRSSSLSESSASMLPTRCWLIILLLGDMF